MTANATLVKAHDRVRGVDSRLHLGNLQPRRPRRARLGPSDASQLPRPTSEQILGTLLQQKNIFPVVVVSLLRFLVPGAPSLASESLNCPVYPYPHVLLHFKRLFHPRLGPLSDRRPRVGAKVLNLPLMVAGLLAYLPLPLSVVN